MLKLDIYPHIFPLAYFERMKTIAQGNPALAAQIKRWLHIPVLWDLGRRMRMMKRFPGYKQVLTLSLPAIEFLGDENQTPELARLANDGMAEIVERHPDLFPAFVASLPMNNVPAALEEMERAIGKLGARGVQILPTSTAVRSTPPSSFPSSSAWRRSTTCRSGCIRCARRSPPTMPASRSRNTRSGGYFRMFYADTSVNGSPSAIRCGLDFYGAGRVLFGTDCPFDLQGGPLFIRETIRALDGMKLKPADRRRIYFGNARRLLRLTKGTQSD